MIRRVLVTGGAAGIGREIVRAFIGAGARVFVSDIDVEALDALAREIPGLMTTACDVSDREDVGRMVA